ncbi:hypothetical protein [Microbulbifer pacificus]|uniref:hypothetical protein n=1 Tax=Microbulbifer pacificus TaxID=407164 RepID=UPI000CF3D6B5|nr:hypothetical protein [Microbulbifer pacificus]
MTDWVAPICVAGVALSLWLIARQHISASAKWFASLAQLGIWLLVWFLFFPPALLPLKSTLSLPTPADELPDSGTVAALDRLHLTGDGLLRDALRDLPPVRLQPSGTTEAPGWQLHWNRDIALGEPLTLEIRLTSGHQTPLRLSLQNPFGGDADSALLSQENPHVILRAQPKLTGNWLYRVRIESDQVSSPREEVLPVTVRAVQSPRVLLWLARPGFESAALGRWLRQSGTPTQVVTQLAPELQRRETFNAQVLRETSLLGEDTPFDLLILDSRLWPQLSPSERGQLTALSGEKSVLWLVDDNSSAGFLEYARNRGMPLEKTERAAAAYPAVAQNEEIPALQLVGYTPAQTGAGDRHILETRSGDTRALYWARVDPQQSLGFVLFSNSYRWQTAGHSSDFARLWKQILDHQLALRGEHAPLTTETPLPLAAHRLQLCSPAFGHEPPQLRLAAGEGTNPSPSAAAGGYGTHRCHQYWPQRAGWYRIGESDNDLYLFAEEAWPEWQTAMARRDIVQMRRARLGPREPVTGKNPLPLTWITLALLALLALTWWRERPTLR